MDWLSPIRELIGFAFLDGLPIIIRALLGFIFVFFVPGFAWTLVFFKGRQISVIERIALSLGLSIALVTLSIFSSNKLLGIKITEFNSILVIIILTIIPVILYYLNKIIRRHRRGANSS